MGWTNPRTWVSLEKPSAATMNTHIRDNLNDLYTGTGWTAITFAAGYATFNGTNFKCEIRRLGSVCSMHGLVKPTVGNFAAGVAVTVATFAAAYRPTVDEVWLGGVSGASSLSRNILAIDGTLIVQPETAVSYVSICRTWVI